MTHDNTLDRQRDSQHRWQPSSGL